MVNVLIAGLVVGLVLVLIIDIGRRAFLMQKFPQAYKADKVDPQEHSHYTEERRTVVADTLRKTIVLRPLARFFEP